MDRTPPPSTPRTSSEAVHAPGILGRLARDIHLGCTSNSHNSRLSVADQIHIQRQYGWRTAKRPGVDYFLAYLSQFYEVVLFTTQHNYVRVSSLSRTESLRTHTDSTDRSSNNREAGSLRVSHSVQVVPGCDQIGKRPPREGL